LPTTRVVGYFHFPQPGIQALNHSAVTLVTDHDNPPTVALIELGQIGTYFPHYSEPEMTSDVTWYGMIWYGFLWMAVILYIARETQRN
jgi:hypothetical protein